MFMLADLQIMFMVEEYMTYKHLKDNVLRIE